MNINFMNFANGIIKLQNDVSELIDKDFDDVAEMRDSLEEIVNNNSWATTDIGFRIIAAKIKKMCELANKNNDEELCKILTELGCTNDEDTEDGK